MSGKTDLLSEILHIAQTAAIKAGRLAFNAVGRSAVSAKSSTNLVTEADVEAEKMIITLIAAAFPGHEILAEETSAGVRPDVPNLWIVDPIDGTNNYAHGIPHCAVSVAYAQGGEVLAGVVYDIFRKELFSAVKGGGAFLNDRPISASRAATIEESIVATGFHYDRSGDLAERTLQATRRLLKANIRDIRRFGSAALDFCWVASGRLDGYFEYMLSPWDYAAGMLIAREAGAVCLDRNGDEMTLSTTGVIIATRALKGALVQEVRWGD
ncbi:MAG: inositol monophosphatase family protein [Kiritimatiellia bacterium]|nr:inositol monophosphatase family protein [Kiritimatiellia bacterium]